MEVWFFASGCAASHQHFSATVLFNVQPNHAFQPTRSGLRPPRAAERERWASQEHCHASLPARLILDLLRRLRLR